MIWAEFASPFNFRLAIQRRLMVELRHYCNAPAVRLRTRGALFFILRRKSGAEFFHGEAGIFRYGGGAVNPKRITVLALGLAMALTWFVSSSVFGCFFNDGESCAVFSLANPAPPPQNAPANLATGPDQELARLQKDLVAFVQEKLGLGEAKSTRELVQLMQLLPQKSDAELAQWLAQAKLLDTGNSPLHTRRIELLRQEQTRRQNERLAQKLAQQEAARQAAARRAAAALASSAPAAPMPSGDSPGAARTPDGSSAYLAPGASLWFKMESLQRLYVWADTGGADGIELAIYSPGTTDFWGTKPVGVGSKNRNEGHDLFWTGRAPGGGTWYARVTNHSGAAVPVSVDFERVKSRIKDFCTSCHGDEFDFETCDSKDPKFCEEFLPSLLKQ